MAASIGVAPQRLWSAATLLFEWTAEFLAANVADADLRAEIDEIVTGNLEWLGLDDYGTEASREMRALLRCGLVPAAGAQFAPDMAGRKEAIALLQALADDM